jgi:hypothetical protein
MEMGTEDVECMSAYGCVMNQQVEHSIIVRSAHTVFM